MQIQRSGSGGTGSSMKRGPTRTFLGCMAERSNLLCAQVRHAPPSAISAYWECRGFRNAFARSASSRSSRVSGAFWILLVEWFPSGHPAAVAAKFHFVPNAFPLLAPREGAAARFAGFCWQIVLFDTSHHSFFVESYAGSESFTVRSESR